MDSSEPATPAPAPPSVGGLPAGAEVTADGIRWQMNRQLGSLLPALVVPAALLPWAALPVMLLDGTVPPVATLAAVGLFATVWSGGILRNLKLARDGIQVRIDDQGLAIGNDHYTRDQIERATIVERRGQTPGGCYLVLSLRGPERDVEYHSTDPVADVAWLAERICEIATSSTEGQRLQREEASGETDVRRQRDQLQHEANRRKDG